MSCRHAEEFRVGLKTGRCGKRLGADAHVRLHNLELFIGQRPPLQQHAVLNSDLADVVQRAGEINEVHIVGVNLV